jgi:two-component system, OmpR family, phosphate regulon sensor histidine kinase PhoR
MNARAFLAYLASPFIALIGAILLVAVVWVAGLFALIPAMILAIALLVVGYLDRPQRNKGPTQTDTDDGEGLAIAILDNLQEPVFLLNLRRKVIAANRAALDLLGENLTGKDLSLSIRNPAALDAVDAVIEGRGRHTIEISLTVPVQRYFRLHAGKIYRDKGRPDRVLIVLTDVTVIRRSEQMRADFVANVSHELRSPLSALVGFIETLKGAARDDPAARDRFLGIMDDEAGRMTRIIDDLLSLSHVETKEHIQPDSQIDLSKLLQRAAATVEIKAKNRNMSVATHSEVSTDLGAPLVIGDDDELMEVFQNLLDNAVKYGREGTAVEIKLRAVERIPEKGGPGLAVSVRNIGDGIAPEHLPRLTERFYRVDKGRSRSMGGTGLGLAIVKHLVSRHRGHLAVSSTLGEATVFTVYLPIRESSSSAS